MEYEHLDDSSFTKFRKTLIYEKGSTKQRDFLEALREHDNFIKYFQNEVKFQESKSLDVLPEKLTENEYKDPPKDTEEKIFKIWKQLKRADACRVTFWGLVTFRHIEKNRIEPFFLAGNGGNLLGGLERIDRVLKNGKPKEIDAAVRDALRRLSGLPEARGNRSVYVNCPLARAWWRQYLAEEIYDLTHADKGKVIEIFRKSNSYWEELIMSVVSRNSILGDSSVRTALVWALSERTSDSSDSKLFIQNTLKEIHRRIGVYSASQELAIYSPKELKKIIEDKFIY